MQAISLEVVMRAVFGSVESERLERLRARLVELTEWVNDPRRLALLAAVGQRSLTASPTFRAKMEPVEAIVLEARPESARVAIDDPPVRATCTGSGLRDGARIRARLTTADVAARQVRFTAV